MARSRRDGANDRRGRTGVVPVGVMRLIPSAPAHVARDRIHPRLAHVRHTSPAFDRTYNRSRAAPLKRICWPGATNSLVGRLRGTVGRTGGRLDHAAGPLAMAAEVALVVPVLASHEIHRPPVLRASLPDPMEDCQ